MNTVTLKAPAKINLTLEVSSADDGTGYHNLSTIFQSLELADTLTIEKASSLSFDIKDNLNSGLEIPADESNLVIKALRLLEKLSGKSLPCHVSLEKNIPAGGGLGGGSADCAAALKGLNELFCLGLCQKELAQAAAKLGADVSFGITGGTALGTGRGEIIEKLPDAPAYEICLLIPPQGLSTPSVYRKWDELPDNKKHQHNRKPSLIIKNMLSRTWDDKLFLESLSNDLEEPAFELYPQLRAIKDSMEKAGCRKAMLCGSGSTLFGILGNSGRKELASELSKFGNLAFTKFRSIQ